MKLRKHRHDKTYQITFKTKGKTAPLQTISATGHCIPSVLRAFMVGRDVSNTLAVVREMKPLWAGRLVVTTLTPISALEFNSLLPV